MKKAKNFDDKIMPCPKCGNTMTIREGADVKRSILNATAACNNCGNWSDVNVEKSVSE